MKFTTQIIFVLSAVNLLSSVANSEEILDPTETGTCLEQDVNSPNSGCNGGVILDESVPSIHERGEEFTDHLKLMREWHK